MALEIAVVGAGTAGAAAATLLSRAGHAVTVFERVDDPRPVGAGILLQPTGQVVLARLGVLEWRRDVLRLEPRVEPLLDAIRDLDRVLFARYRDVAMHPWHGDRIVFVGDAAHATSPQLGARRCAGCITRRQRCARCI